MIVLKKDIYKENHMSAKSTHPPLQVSKNVPVPGFYYHKNHDPAGPGNNNAYELVAVSSNSKDAYPDDYGEIVAYRPLYAHPELPRERSFCTTLHTFMETVDVGGVKVPRFRLIENPTLARELARIRDQMYGTRME